MQIAIYDTNPVPEKPGYGGDAYGPMFEDMLGPLMRDTTFTHFDVVGGVFPVSPTLFDALIITGSSAFVTDGDLWIQTLFDHIRQADAAKMKLFAVCFGHQAVAVALGGVVEARDVVLGTPRLDVLTGCEWMQPRVDSLRLYSGNFQQVTTAPATVDVIGSHPDCPVAMMRKGDHLLALQFHPELSADYMHRYVDLVADRISRDKAAEARVSFSNGSDGAIFAKWAAAFLTS